jgi:hypothetical protein
MPRHVRNFWVEAECDARRHPIGTGPKKRGGGIDVQVYIRDNNSVRNAIDIRGYADGEELVLHVIKIGKKKNRILATIRTKR